MRIVQAALILCSIPILLEANCRDSFKNPTNKSCRKIKDKKFQIRGVKIVPMWEYMLINEPKHRSKRNTNQIFSLNATRRDVLRQSEQINSSFHPIPRQPQIPPAPRRIMAPVSYNQEPRTLPSVESDKQKTVLLQPVDSNSKKLYVQAAHIYSANVRAIPNQSFQRIRHANIGSLAGFETTAHSTPNLKRNETRFNFLKARDEGVNQTKKTSSVKRKLKKNKRRSAKKRSHKEVRDITKQCDDKEHCKKSKSDTKKLKIKNKKIGEKTLKRKKDSAEEEDESKKPSNQGEKKKGKKDDAAIDDKVLSKILGQAKELTETINESVTKDIVVEKSKSGKKKNKKGDGDKKEQEETTPSNKIHESQEENENSKNEVTGNYNQNIKDKNKNGKDDNDEKGKSEEEENDEDEEEDKDDDEDKNKKEEKEGEEKKEEESKEGDDDKEKEDKEDSETEEDKEKGDEEDTNKEEGKEGDDEKEKGDEEDTDKEEAKEGDEEEEKGDEDTNKEESKEGNDEKEKGDEEEEMMEEKKTDEDEEAPEGEGSQDEDENKKGEKEETKQDGDEEGSGEMEASGDQDSSNSTDTGIDKFVVKSKNHTMRIPVVRGKPVVNMNETVPLVEPLKFKSNIREDHKSTKYSDKPNIKYSYPPQDTLPLQSCFYNPSGYVCCNLKLNNVIEKTYKEIRESPDFNPCNLQKIANRVQAMSEKTFEHPFETVAAHADFAQNVNFSGDLVCKLEVDGKYIIAYGTPYMAEKAVGPETPDGSHLPVRSFLFR